MLAAKHDVPQDGHSLGPQLDTLLNAYVNSTGGTAGGVPSALIHGATDIAAKDAPIQQSGPADAVAYDDTSAEETDRRSYESAAVLQDGLDELEPLHVRDALARHYGIHAQVTAELEAAEATGDTDAASRLERENLQAVQNAVRSHRRLHHEDIRRQLDEFHRSLSSETPTVPLPQSNTMLSSFSLDFWTCLLYTSPSPRD